MKFARHAKILRSQLDAAPFAAVFFLLVIFLMLGSLAYTPGVRLQLPMADDLPGTDQPSLAVAIDANGRLYFENQVISESQLRERLIQAAKESAEPLTLVVHADVATTMDMLVRLSMLARGAGITNSWLATLPRPVARAQ